jgi:uncharacterized protein (TIGR01777 family)
MRVIVTGGSGLLGRSLGASLAADGHEVIGLSRRPEGAGPVPGGMRLVGWDGETARGWGELADGADVIVNFAGESIGGSSVPSILFGRWTESRKRGIVESRSNAGRAVVEAVRSAKRKPRLVVQASAAGFYGTRRDEELGEEVAAGDDFLARTCLEWEAASEPVTAFGVRRVVIRSGVVLTLRGGIFPMVVLPFRLFAGGPLGTGRQWFPWIHLDDEIRAIRHLISQEGAQGPYNLAAPGAITYAELARVLGRAMRRPSFLRVPGFALRLLMGEKSTLVLDGQRPAPRRLLEAGFVFRFPTLEPALKDLLEPGVRGEPPYS